MWVRRLGKWIKRCLLAGALIWSLTLLAVVAYAYYPAPARTTATPADAIICLGAGMSETQGWYAPDTASRGRAVTCATLYQQGAAPVIIFTGYGHPISSAAAAMGRVATEHGVPESAIVLEEQARSTIQNAAFSLALVPTDAERIIIVSDRFHLPRAGVIFRLFSDLGVDTYPVDASAFEEPPHGERNWPTWLIRESVAVWYNVARGLAYWAGGVVGIPQDTRIGWFN